MKSRILFLFILLSFTFLSAQTPTCPFSKGFNLGAWFEFGSAKEIPNWYTKTSFKNLQMLGCDVIRLPINLNGMSGGAPDYTIDPILFKLLDRTVDWAEELGIHIILDNHDHGDIDASDPATTEKLIAIWQQMSEHFKNRSALVYYEICNEPYGISDADWSEMQRLAIAAIRAIDQAHTIIVGPAAFNDIYHLYDLPIYEDDNLIYTFHFYDPFLFTHQGSNWTVPSMEDVTGVPYPYDASRMPSMPVSWQGTWLENVYNGYADAGKKASLQSKMDVALNFQAERNVPVFCGEFGALQSEGTEEDRLRWYQDIGDILNANNVAWTMWGYSGGFGIFKKDLFGFPQDLDLPIVEALGLTVPPPGPYPTTPDSEAIVLYDDLLSAEVKDVSFGAGTKDYWNDIDPKIGDFCISWKDADQYANISWQFAGNRDLSYLYASGFSLSFWMKANAPNMLIDVRFLDTDLNDGIDHPWRMSKTIDKNNATLDGSWGLVKIPLTEMIDSGSWDDNAWYNPQGLFDWTKIDKLEFVAEHQSLNGIEIKFDDVKIVKIYYPDLALLKPNGGEKWIAGSIQPITWSSKDINDIKIAYTSDNSATWHVIVDSIPAANKSFDWQIPEISSSQCKIRITTLDETLADTSNNTFSILNPAITILTPNGGEIWKAKSKQSISWTSQDVDTINIEYSVTNGTNWQTAVNLLDAGTGSYEWTVPDTTSQECLIKISDNSDSSIFDLSDAVFEIAHPTSVKSRDAVPDKLQLFGNFPNPFNPQTTIEFGVPKSGHVKLAVYNNLGQLVGIIVDKRLDSGFHKVVLNSNFFGTCLSSGIYFYRINFEQATLMGKMVLMR